MPVHFSGQSCDMKPIMEIAEKHNLKIIEDSAETAGGEYYKRKTGSFGIAACFSFYPIKNMTTGEGGMLTTNDDSLARDVSILKAHGIAKDTLAREKERKPWLRNAIKPGHNFRMCDVLAAIGLIQLKKLDEMNDMRRKNASYLNKNIMSELIEKPVERSNCKHVYQMYTIKISGIDRDSFVSELNKKGIKASVHFDPPVHLQDFYLNMGYKGDFPTTEKLAKNIVTLPMFPHMNKEQLGEIVNSIEEVIKSCSKKSNS